MTFRAGDLVVKNPAKWVPSGFDGWGAGEGVGVVVEPPFDPPEGEVEVQWPACRCFRKEAELLPSPLTARGQFQLLGLTLIGLGGAIRSAAGENFERLRRLFAGACGRDGR